MSNETNDEPSLPNVSSAMIPRFNQHGAALTQAQRESLAKKKGLCVTCGVKTHDVTLLSTKALTNDDAYQGICIRDNPSTVPAHIYQVWQSKFQPTPLPAGAASARCQELHDNDNDMERGELHDEETRSAPNVFVRGGVAMMKSSSFASMASEYPSEEPNNVAQILPEEDLCAKKDLDEQMIVPTQSPSLLGDIKTHDRQQAISEATSGSYNNAVAALISTQIIPGAIRVGGNNGQHVYDNHHSLLHTVADQNIETAPTTTMVEAERVDLFYGVAEAVNAGDSKEEEENISMSCTLSKQSIMIGLALLLMVTAIVAPTVVVNQNKNKSPPPTLMPTPMPTQDQVAYSASFAIASGGCNGNPYFEFGCLGGGQLSLSDTTSRTAYEPVCGPHSTLGDSYRECTIDNDNPTSSAVIVLIVDFTVTFTCSGSTSQLAGEASSQFQDLFCSTVLPASEARVVVDLLFYNVVLKQYERDSSCASTLLVDGVCRSDIVCYTALSDLICTPTSSTIVAVVSQDTPLSTSAVAATNNPVAPTKRSLVVAAPSS